MIVVFDLLKNFYIKIFFCRLYLLRYKLNNVKMTIFGHSKGNDSYKESSDNFGQIETFVGLLILYNRYAIRFPVSLLVFEIIDI